MGGVLPWWAPVGDALGMRLGLPPFPPELLAFALVGLVSAVAAAPIVVFVLFAAKVGAKIFGLYPVIGRFRHERKERWYYSLMMSTGLTFGTISALYGLNHEHIDKAQYSALVVAVLASEVK